MSSTGDNGTAFLGLQQFEGLPFQAFHLCVTFIFLALCRSISRTALSGRFRLWLAVKLPDWASNLVLFSTQWWFLLALILTIELIVTKGNVLAVMDATLNVKKDMGWLATLSRWICPACLVTYALVLVSIAAQVLFMPMVYHLMMCRSLLRRWAAVNGDPHKNGMAADGDSALAEMYDAYALWCFGNLGMLVAERDLRRGGEESSLLFQVLQGTLMFGVKSYVVTTVMESVFSIGLAFVVLNVPGQGELCHDDTGGICAFTQIIYGAGFATSTIAIYNLFSFEHQLQGPLEKFYPAWKFWSMKIPITLSFGEKIVLKLVQPLTGLGQEEQELLDTMTKAYFMMLVSLLNVVAWHPAEEWYYWKEVCQEEKETFCPCGGSQSRGEEIPSSSDSEAEESDNCEEDAEVAGNDFSSRRSHASRNSN